MQPISPFTRAKFFEESFPDYVRNGAGFFCGNPNGVESIFATWFGGRNYAAKTRVDPATNEPYYGAYPAGYLERIFTMFPDARSVLHLFSGALTQEVVFDEWCKAMSRLAASEEFKDKLPLEWAEPPAQVLFDRRGEMKPTVVGDAEKLTTYPLFRKPSFDAVFVDPPYSEEDAWHYGASLCDKKKVIQEAAKVLRPGGSLIWMDQAWPWAIGAYGLTLYGTISWYRSMNHRIRGVMLFVKS